ncbi:MAG TPA: hypothetical protein VGE93_10800, partial [Bryobacteraceae bacterium]
ILGNGLGMLRRNPEQIFQANLFIKLDAGKWSPGPRHIASDRAHIAVKDDLLILARQGVAGY